MLKKNLLDIEIDKLTRSIENAISGKSFKTEMIEMKPAEINEITENDWVFDWKKEEKQLKRKVYKLVVVENPGIIQGLLSLQDRGDHIFMSLIESSKFNRGEKKLFLGVPGNMVAFACNISFEKGYSGYVSFENKTKLIEHYKKTLGAQILFGNFMAIDTKAASKLIAQYFPENL